MNLSKITDFVKNKKFISCVCLLLVFFIILGASVSAHKKYVADQKAKKVLQVKTAVAKPAPKEEKKEEVEEEKEEEAPAIEEKKEETPAPAQTTEKKASTPKKPTHPSQIGWITVPNTAINYPVMMSNENQGEDYYLTHDSNNKYTEVGSIYAQMCNSFNFTDFETTLYGHQCRGTGKMFNNIHYYKDPNFLASTPYFTIKTYDGKTLTYQVFAAFTRNSDITILSDYQYFINDEWKQKFLDYCREQGTAAGIYNEAAAPSINDRIVTLSTCTGDHSERYTVHAKLVSQQ